MFQNSKTKTTHELKISVLVCELTKDAFVAVQM